MVTTLLYGFVLLPLPAFSARLVTVLCLGTGAALLPLVFRLADRDFDRSHKPPHDVRGGERGGVSESLA